MNTNWATEATVDVGTTTRLSTTGNWRKRNGKKWRLTGFQDLPGFCTLGPITMMGTKVLAQSVMNEAKLIDSYFCY